MDPFRTPDTDIVVANVGGAAPHPPAFSRAAGCGPHRAGRGPQAASREKLGAGLAHVQNRNGQMRGHVQDT